MAKVDACWMDATDLALAQLVDDLVLAHELSASGVPGSIRVLTQILAPALDELHAAVLATRLLAAADTLVARLHGRTAGTPDAVGCACGDAAWSGVAAFTMWPNADPRETFAEWLDRFFAHFDRAHPRTAAGRAAHLIRLDPVRPWRMRELAESVDVSPSALHRRFAEEFGIRVTEYVQLARTERAVGLFGSSTKVDAIAWDVGYRSKKDLYAALKRWVDATPSELRALTDEERRWLSEGLRDRMRSRAVRARGQAAGPSRPAPAVPPEGRVVRGTGE